MALRVALGCVTFRRDGPFLADGMPDATIPIGQFPQRCQLASKVGRPRKGITMFIALAVILALAWILGFAIFHIASVAIHVLVLAAIVSVVVHFLRRGKGTT